MPDHTQETPRGARFSVNLRVECYPSLGLEEIKAGQPSEVSSFEGEVHNISSGGACLVSTRPLQATEVLKISFPIQSSISAFISTPRTLVEVRWTKSANQQDKYISGLRFLL